MADIYRVPKGIVYYEGPTRYQSGVYLGGVDNNQIFIPKKSQKSFELLNEIQIEK